MIYKKQTLYPFLISLLSIVCLGSFQALAQDEDDEIYELSPFIVNTSGDIGYQAESTLQGTRINSALRDIAAPISVFTKEFLDDIGATSVEDVTKYMPNFEQELTENSAFHDGHVTVHSDTGFRVRGLANGAVTRDNFRWSWNGDGFNYERIDFSRGPNSILFGIGSAAGTINQTSKQARFSDFNFLQFRVGSYSHLRAHLDANREIVDGKFAFRVNLLHDNTETWREHEYREADRGAVAATFRPWEKTTLRLAWEGATVDQVAYRPWGAHDHVSGWLAAGKPLTDILPFWPGSLPHGAGGTRIQWAGFENYAYVANDGVVRNYALTYVGRYPLQFGGTNELDGMFGNNLMDIAPVEGVAIDGLKLAGFPSSLRGPGATSDFDYDVYNVFLEQGIGDNLFIELAFNKHVSDSDVISNGMFRYAQPLYGDPMAVLKDLSPNPHAGEFFTITEGQRNPTGTDADTVRATVAYKLDFSENENWTRWLGSWNFAALYENWENDSYQMDIRNYLSRFPGNPNPPVNPYNSQLEFQMRTYLDFENGPRSAANYAEVMPTSVTIDGDTVSTHWLLFQGTDNIEELESQSIAAQGFLFNRRLVVTGGVRSDEQNVILSQRLTDPVTNFRYLEKDAFREGPRDGDTYTLGAVGHITRTISVFYNESENFIPQGDQRGIGGIPLQDVEGIGKDYGVRFSFLDDQVTFSAGKYETSDTGAFLSAQFIGNPIREIWRTMASHQLIPFADWEEFDGLTPQFVGDTRDNVSDGYELSLLGNFMENRLSIMFNYSENDSVDSNRIPNMLKHIADNRDFWLQNGDRIMSPGAVGDFLDPDDPSDLYQGVKTVGEVVAIIENTHVPEVLNDQGTSARGLTREKINFWANYTFDERLQGWSVGGGIRYRSGKLMQYTTIDAETREPIYGNSYTLADAKVGYKFKMFDDKVDVNVQLNVTNVADDRDVVLTRSLRNGIPINYHYQTPREWRLSGTFNF